MEIHFHKVTGKGQERCNRTLSPSLLEHQFIQPIQRKTNLLHEAHPVIWIGIHIPKKNSLHRKFNAKQLNPLEEQNAENENQPCCCFCAPTINANLIEMGASHARVTLRPTTAPLASLPRTHIAFKKSRLLLCTRAIL